MKILISGDSWAMGEWPEKPEDDIKHKGLEQYLIDTGHQVTNLSRGGDSLKTIYENLQNIKEIYDYIFVFTVEPFAEIDDNNFWFKTLTYNDYYNRHKESIKNFVQCLNTLDIGPIKLIGGSAKCLQEYTINTNIEIAIPSIIELLIPGIRQYDMNFQYHYHLLNETNIDKVTLEKVVTQAEKWDIIYKNPIMHPDGNHPNRHGHFEVYKVLKLLYGL
tara:strand:+ start:1415 stop:2068 length:654 start_codon:yes stop_codon:yes gene_type:complete